MYNPKRVHKEIIKTAHKNKLLQQQNEPDISWWQQFLHLISFKWVLPPFG